MKFLKIESLETIKLNTIRNFKRKISLKIGNTILIRFRWKVIEIFEKKIEKMKYDVKNCINDLTRIYRVRWG